MQLDEAPCFANRRVEFPPSVTNCLRDEREDVSPLLGGILSDSKLAWLSKGPLLEIVDTSDGSKLAAWTFGAVVRDFKTKITCVAELPRVASSAHRCQVDQLLIGLECELTGGMLCIFNIAGSRVLRAINLPSKVTTIDVVSLGGKLAHPLHKGLHDMVGIAVVGTNDGQILLVDLRRNLSDAALLSGHVNHWDGLHDELHPCELFSLEQGNFDPWEESLDKHVCLHLNERDFMKHQRLEVHFSSGMRNSFLPDDPSVTSVLYVPQLASVCVGFAFGSFQIWSLQTLSHVYTLPAQELQPVVQLSFQEACDDPNASCYLWAIRGGLGRDKSYSDLSSPVSVFGPPLATMYSLCFDEKVQLPDYSYRYQNFLMCSTVFEHELSGDKDTVGGRLVTLAPVNRGMPVSSSGQPPPEDSSALGHSSNAISLCLIVWETWGPTGPTSTVNPVNTHMVLFDINQWYVDQMPGRLSVRGGLARHKSVASYLVSHDLQNVLSSSGGLLLDVHVNPCSLLQFYSVQNVEEFSKPSSLAFGSIALMERQVVHLKHPGVQRAFLSSLVSSGPGALMTPTNLFHECLVLGLRPLLMDVSTSVNVPLDDQRTYVLCVALEQRLARFVWRCAQEWADGRLAAAGCTLSWLLSVAWNRAAVLKQLAIRLCAQLFDHSGEKLDSNAQRQLHHIVGVFHNLEILFENVVQNKWHLSLNEWPQVNLQNDALKLECQYYDVQQWFIDVELLPEGPNATIPYPVQEIAVVYQTRRLELQHLFDQQGKDKEMRDFLLIDALLKNQPAGANVSLEWERDAGGSAGLGGGLYPPASLQALLRTFLVKDVALEVKHSIVIYVLMDLADMLDSTQYFTALQNFMKFPAAFGISPGSMRLTQAFWYLDHKTFDTALDLLLDPLVSVGDIELWQHRCVIRLLTVQGQTSLALRYIRARQPLLQEPSDISLHLYLLIANNLIDEAFVYQRNHRTEENSKVLLSEFFQGCEERNHLKTILQFCLDEDEESAFSRYLENSRHPAADDLRVLYLLKRSRYVEALEVQQDLKRKGRSGSTRDVVVNGFFKTLPSVTRKLAAHCAQQHNKLKSWSQVEKPSPLFVNPKIVSPRMRYQSSLIEAAVEKSRETWNRLVDRIHPVTSEIESTPFLCTPRAKLFSFSRSTSDTNIQHPNLDRKRPREEDANDCSSDSRFKRSRFQKLETALAELQQQQQQDQHKQARLSTYSCTDTLQLLHTPLVQRRSPSSRAKLQQQLLAFSPGHSKVTPQSIIKVRQESISNSPNHHHISKKKQINEPELTEEESESEVFSKSTQPSKGESETDSEPGDKEEDEGPVLAGARRIIDFDSDVSSSDLSLSQTSFDSNLMQSQTLSVLKSPAFNLSSEKSLSKMVVLSEARKIGKPAHNVTFGKGSICVYDQDEPVDSEVAVQDESSNDTIDQEPSKDEDSEANICLEKEEENCEKVPDKKLSSTHLSEPRLFRLDTSGIGTMSSEAIQSDLSITEDSEVFHSAESIAPTISSPLFRKSLARPSVKEIALGLYGSKQAHDGDCVEPMKEKLDQLDHSSSNPSTLQQSLSSSEYEMAEDENIQGSSVLALSSFTQGDSPFRNLKRSPIKDYLPSVDMAESSSSIQKKQQSKHLSCTTNQEGSSTREEDETETKDSVEVVDLDEESNSITDQTENVKEDASCGMMYDEDSGEKKGYLTENSNIFGMSNIDSADSSSDQESELSASKEDIEDDLISEDSYHQILDENSDSHCTPDVNEEVNIDHMETSTSDEQQEPSKEKVIVASISKPQSSSENLNQNVEITEDITPDVVESCVALEQPSVVEVEQCIAVDKLEVLSHVAEKCDARDASVLEITDAAPKFHDAPQIYERNAEESKGNTMESDDALLNQGCFGDFGSERDSLVLTDKQSLGSCELPIRGHKQVSSTLVNEGKIDIEQEDMPKLRLDSGTTETSPELISNASSVESCNSEHQETSPSKTIELDASGKICDISEDVPYEDLQVAAKESLQSTLKNLPTSSAVVGYTPASPSVKTPKRKEKIRTVSTSSSKSEALDEDISNRRVTRGMKQSVEPLPSLERSSGQMLHEPLAGTPEEYQQVVGSPAKGQKRRRGSQSSKDGHVQNVPNLPRTRRGSESSVSSQVDDPKSRSRIRTSSVSSQGSTAPNDRLSQAKLGKISEEDSASEESNVKATRGNQRKVSTSAKSPSSAKSVVLSEAATSAIGGQALPDDYESNRRLTRHQRSLLTKGVGIPSSSKLDLLSKDEEQDMDEDRMSQYSVRSSQRLREKHHQGSPSSIASSVKETKGQFQTANPASSKIVDYENTRRLTRHQRALLAKSMEISAVDCRDQSLLHEEDQQHSDDDAMSLSSVRSSQPRKRKRQQSAVEGSPSSTASTVTNPALTPSSSRRRRQGRTEEVNRDVSPVSSIKRQRSAQTPGTPSSLANTPTRRSARLNALHSAQKSEDGDSQSVASLSPSSVTSGRRSISRRLSRQLSVSSEAPSEQFAFASPHVENPSASENAYGDVSLTEAFSFSPPKTLVTTSKTKSSSSEQSSTSKKSSRQTRAYTLQTIKEESSTSKISQEDTVLISPDIRSSNRPSWLFIEPPDVAGKNKESEEPQHTKQVMVTSENQRGWHSAYQHRSKYLLNLPKTSDGDGDESEEESTQDENMESKQKPRK